MDVPLDFAAVLGFLAIVTGIVFSFISSRPAPPIALILLGIFLAGSQLADRWFQDQRQAIVASIQRANHALLLNITKHIYPVDRLATSFDVKLPHSLPDETALSFNAYEKWIRSTISAAAENDEQLLWNEKPEEFVCLGHCVTRYDTLNLVDQGFQIPSASSYFLSGDFDNTYVADALAQHRVHLFLIRDDQADMLRSGDLLPSAWRDGSTEYHIGASRMMDSYNLISSFRCQELNTLICGYSYVVDSDGTRRIRVRNVEMQIDPWKKRYGINTVFDLTGLNVLLLVNIGTTDGFPLMRKLGAGAAMADFDIRMGDGIISMERAQAQGRLFLGNDSISPFALIALPEKPDDLASFFLLPPLSLGATETPE